MGWRFWQGKRFINRHRLYFFFEGGGLIGLFFYSSFSIPALIYSKYKAYWEYRSLILILIALALFNLKDLAFYSHGIIQSYIIILFMLNENSETLFVPIFT